MRKPTRTILTLVITLLTLLVLGGCASSPTGRIAEDGKIVATDTDVAPDGYPKSWGQPIGGSFDAGLNLVTMYQVQKVYSEDDAKKTELYAILAASLPPEQLKGRGVIVRAAFMFGSEVSDDMVPSGGIFNRGLVYDAYLINPAMRSTVALGDIVAVLIPTRYGDKMGKDTKNPVGNMLRVIQTVEKNTKGYGSVRSMECVHSFLNSPIYTNLDCLTKVDTAAARKWAIESWKISPRK